MGIILKIIVLILGIVAGVGMMTHSYQLTQLFGYNSLAERYLGTGGTYSMWKLLGLLTIIGAFLYAF
jgi:hypothetical protein